MRSIRIWARLRGVAGTTIEDVDLSEDGSLVVRVRPRRRQQNRCGVCGRLCFHPTAGADDLNQSLEVRRLLTDAPPDQPDR